jgi:NAD(P)-dependent dehydrogenase (short-subunit alcohol dehydrogenase family)
MIIEKTGLDRSELHGKIAVITGAGQGIGRETARALAHLGAAVVIAELSDSGLETKELIGSEGGQALFLRTDVADPASMERLKERVLESYGKADILVNNAAFLTVKPVLEHSLEEWDRVLAVNLHGAFLGIKAFLPGMLKRRHGIVITMESAEGMPYLAPYLASKVGLRSLAISLAQEIGAESGVSVYCFAPGIVDTPGLTGAFHELAPRYKMSFEDFIQQSGLPLITAELCATGLVGTILHARDFHGQETSYVEGLARLGLGPTGESLMAETVPAKSAPISSERTGTYQEATHLNRELEDILGAYAKEFGELNILMRPVAKRMFRQDTGMTVEDWQLKAQAMTRILESGNRTSELDAYTIQLGRLAEHIAKQEATVPTWIKDPQARQLALNGLQRRRETVEKLASILASG